MKRSLLLILILLSLLADPASLAGQGRATQRAPQRQATATAQAPQPQAKFVNRTLANGLEIIVVEDHSIPLVTCELAVRNGSFTEPPELNGLSHLYEHMFFKANRASITGEAYLAIIDQLGIVYNAQTQEEVVNYYFTTTSPNFPVALRFMRDSALYPLFNERQFEQEREVVIGELDRHESNPFGLVTAEMNDRLFFQYPSRKKPGGTRETVSKATTEMMRLIQGRYYVPNNSAIVVTGDVNPENVFTLVQELFGAWQPREKDPFAEFPLVEHPPLPKSEGVIIKQPIQNVIIHLGWHGPSIGKDNDATYAADVFSFILRQPNSRFQRALVDSGLVAGVNLNYYTQRNVGPISILAQTSPDKARAAMRALYNEVAHFNDPNYYTDEQLETAKALLEANDLFDREKLSEYSHVISFWWASTGVDYYRGYLGNLRKTTRADISRYVKTYIQGKPHVGLAILSEESARISQLTPEDLIGEGSRNATAAGR